MTTILIYMAVAIVFSAICSVCEACLSSTPISYVSSLEGAPGYKTLRRFKENMNTPLSAILVINTIANTVGASLVGSAAADYVTAQGGNYATFVGWVSGIFTLLILLFAEILPKTIGANYWKTLILPISRIIKIMVYITYPIVWLLGCITKLFSNPEATSVSTEEIAAMASEGAKDGVIDSKENKIIHQVLKLDNIKAEDIMTPVSVVEKLDEDEVIPKGDKNYDYLMTGNAYSRIPVVNETNICIGYVLKDEFNPQDDSIEVKKYIRQIESFPDTTTVSEMFDRMIKAKEHIVAIVDEYGSFRGIVTLEDIVETMLGTEIVDETDDIVDMQEYAKSQYKQMHK